MTLGQDFRPDGFQRECIYVDKVYNECSLTDCPTYRIPIPPGCPPVVNVVDCVITDITVEGFVVGPGDISINIDFIMNVEYDGNGTPRFIQQTAQYRRNSILLNGALPGMQVVVLPLLRCIGCRPANDGNFIECDVGIFLVIKAVALVQLEILGRFCPEPPACEQVSPIGCAQWFEMAERGEFWPPFPPQPTLSQDPPAPRPPVRPRPPGGPRP